MNKKEYAITCNECKSTNVKYDYLNAKIDSENREVSIPVKCLDCGYETTEKR